MEKQYDLTGQKFNRLTVISFHGKDNNRSNVWNCICECGNESKVNSSSLRCGHTKSCGCVQREIASKLRPVIHGDSIGGKVSTEYNTWGNIKSRCSDVKDKDYKNYGGRGIKVCDRWLDKENGYINFLSDMGRKPTPKHSIDRYPNNNGNYEPSNCRWATVPEQSRGRRSNVWIEYNGELFVLIDWAEKVGDGYKHFHRKIKQGRPFFGFQYSLIEKNKYNATDYNK